MTTCCRCGSRTAKPQRSRRAPTDGRPRYFAARVAETFDSVELLLAARAEAEEAEAQAKAQPETALPFAKEDKKAAPMPTAPGGATGGSRQRRSRVAGAARDDDDSPAAIGLLGDGPGRAERRARRRTMALSAQGLHEPADWPAVDVTDAAAIAQPEVGGETLVAGRRPH